MFRSLAEAAKRRREAKEKAREREEERERLEQAEHDLLVKLGREVVTLRQRGVRLHRSLDDTLAEYERLRRQHRLPDATPPAEPRPRHWAFNEHEVLRRLEEGQRDETFGNPKAEG